MVLSRVKKTIKEYDLIQKKDRLLVAYSGGIDSTALLHILLKLREEWALEIVLAHFNHRMRAKADEDEKFVRSVAQEYSLPLVVGAEEVRRVARQKKLSIEEAGRLLRYDFFIRTADKRGTSKIATGHTLDDQAETLLMRILRGSGTRGMAGIYPAVDGMIIRPLIEVERKDIVTYLKKSNIPYRVDESNIDRRFLRNRIRMDLLPFIQKNFEPRIIPILGKMASIFQQEEALLQELAEEEAQKAISRKKDKTSLNTSSLSSLSLALRRRVIREFIRCLRGDLRGITLEDVESLLGLKEGKEIHLKKGLILVRDGNLVYPKVKKRPRIRYEYRWDGKNPLDLKEAGIKVMGRIRKKGHLQDLDFDDERRAFFDKSQVQFPLIVRGRREGDRYQPLGAPGTKKLKEIMRARGIPLQEREKRPVFLSKGEIIWVLGLPVSDKHKVSSEAEHIFTIQKL